MCLLPTDGRFLERALELARAAAAFASPNPAVGCVLTRGGEVLAEGAHRYDLRDHAEIVALKAAWTAGHDLRGATAFVTLEPCSHVGRTGPCADALIAAGIARCVVATVDPNPAVRGDGLRKLRQAGVTVALADAASSIAEEARRLNDAFAFSVQYGRPFVTLKAAVSRDGYLAPPPSSRADRQPFWLTGPAARVDVQQLRHTVDCILTGIGTVLADDPLLTDRTGRPRRRPLLRVVLDSDLRLSLRSQLVCSANDDLLVIASPQASLDHERALATRGVEVVRISEVASGLPRLLGLLAARDVRGVLLEAGSAVNGSFLSAHLVDELVVYHAPVPLGPLSLPFAAGQPAPDALEAQLTKVRSVSFARSDEKNTGEDRRVSGYLHDPWASVDREAAPISKGPAQA